MCYFGNTSLVSIKNSIVPSSKGPVPCSFNTRENSCHAGKKNNLPCDSSQDLSAFLIKNVC
jgi:hypothetical protein